MKVSNGGQQIDVPGLKKLDQASSTIWYIGEALPGIGDAYSAWMIKRITFDSGGNYLKTEWANSAEATAKWSDRATLTYA